jgi:2-isopropylmalate synthase
MTKSKSLKNQSVEIYDTTLRDGSQGEGISFSVQDKLRIAEKLDQLGVAYIEGGWPGSNPKDQAFFKEALKIKFKNAKLTAFGSTRRAGTKASEDGNLRDLVASRTPAVTIFGKTWDFHVKEALRVPLTENLDMISDSVKFLKSKGREVIYDAEHFFDGYKANPDYAIKTLQAAYGSGARVLVLCDTNGGTLPSEIARIVTEVKGHIDAPLGIHTHNDAGTGIANALAAVECGARHVQGTINGFGERCGNADLVALIANLQLKMGFACIEPSHMKQLTETAHYIGEVANLVIQNNQPYVGKSAFAHKGGVHINAMLKNPKTYEHILPEVVGNSRRFLTSELSGKSNIMIKAQALDASLTKESPKTKKIHELVQKLENEGYQFEAAEASFELLVHKTLTKHKPFFDVLGYKAVVISEANQPPVSEATVHLKVKGAEELTAAQGDGPVNALDSALRKALSKSYPQLTKMHLSDFKVRVLDQKSGTAAKVRVFVESTDENGSWTTVGISENMIEASWRALLDSIEYKLLKR